MAYIDLGEQNFNETVENNDMVIIDFWAEWCGPCKQFAPVFEQAAEENTDIVFAKVNTEVEKALSDHFQIRSIPTLMVIREKVLVFNQAGALAKDGLDGLIKQVKELDMVNVHKEIQEKNNA